MKSNWKVTSQSINDTKMYAVYRLRDVNEVCHSGNMEYATIYNNNRPLVQFTSDLMNQMPTASGAYWLDETFAIYDDNGNMLAVYPIPEELIP